MKRIKILLLIVLCLTLIVGSNVYSAKRNYTIIKKAKFNQNNVQGNVYLAKRGNKLYLITDNFMCQPRKSMYFLLSKKSITKTAAYAHSDPLPADQFRLMNYTVKMRKGIYPQDWSFILLFDSSTNKVLARAKLEIARKK